MPLRRFFKQNLPGIMLSVAVTLAAFGLERWERSAFGYAWVDSLVISILLGTGINTIIGLRREFAPGVKFAAKTLLEIAIVLLGASISLATLVQSGPTMASSVVVVVVLSLAISYFIARLFGLSERLATLVACGNSICGNSAIVAAAPVIGAEADDVAASISFTAALGIVVVLLLPIAFEVLSLTQWQYGVVAGMTVYAVPQVLAATVPIGIVSTEIGTIVKLMRVLMLGPVILLLGLYSSRRNRSAPLAKLVPWFIIGFLAMILARSLDLIPLEALAPVRTVSSLLTIVAMAALGLSVNLRMAFASGGRVLAAGACSLAVLALLSTLVLMIVPMG